MTELLFVYNADAGLVAGAMDLFHKILSPATYPCSLCAVTYGNLGMKPEWREFIKSLPVQATFLHRDELHAQHPELAATPLPAVFRRAGTAGWQVFLAAEELNQTDLPGLMALVRERLGQPA
ncbi:hypothetical protein [Hymenobacter weizhouensis]|uniref:hypothetical protein n=1 Tax=Hymenobacter sp. YIM 151500-1 TaxID=2987689 RepID=UPI0022268730|nr:hypothetical protein [Hymenobacter sp. YIM 151500-1]UYZ63964.1 hypothetical protein OIS53_03755 [Hymenobacter sp. YIM 151500-1]